MLLGMLYELIADLKRYREDKKVNAHPVLKVTVEGQETKTHHSRADQIYVGDIIKLEND